MSNPEIIGALALAVIAGLLGGYFWGIRDGERLGRDKEWMDSFFRDLDKDKLKRDRLGRFKQKTK
jgi:hypothetical protein